MSEKKTKNADSEERKKADEKRSCASEGNALCCEKKQLFFFEKNPMEILFVLKNAAQSGEFPNNSVSKAIRHAYGSISLVPIEDIVRELQDLICGKYAAEVLDEYREVFACIIPELEPMFDLDQRSPYHNRDVWHHTLAGLADIPPFFELRMAMLLHDIAKPVVFILDDNGRGRFVGHPQKGAEMAYRILHRMGYPAETIKKIVRLVRYHDVKFRSLPEDIIRIMAVFGRRGFEALLAVRHADAAGKYEKYLSEAEEKNAVYRAWAESIFEKGMYFAPEDLAVTESDLRQAGFTEEFNLWQVQEKLLMDTAAGKIENEKTALLRAAKESE